MFLDALREDYQMISFAANTFGVRCGVQSFGGVRWMKICRIVGFACGLSDTLNT